MGDTEGQADRWNSILDGEIIYLQAKINHLERRIEFGERRRTERNLKRIREWTKRKEDVGDLKDFIFKMRKKL